MHRNYTCTLSNSRGVVLSKAPNPVGRPYKDLVLTKRAFTFRDLPVPAVGQKVVCQRYTTYWTTEWVPVKVKKAR